MAAKSISASSLSLFRLCVDYLTLYNFSHTRPNVVCTKQLKSTYKDLNINETLYVRCNLGECISTTQITIERMNYAKVTFELYSIGKTGYTLVGNYNFKMTIRSLIYYLCVQQNRFKHNDKKPLAASVPTAKGVIIWIYHSHTNRLKIILLPVNHRAARI